jgi:hypothetical protein
MSDLNMAVGIFEKLVNLDLRLRGEADLKIETTNRVEMEDEQLRKLSVEELETLDAIRAKLDDEGGGEIIH